MSLTRGRRGSPAATHSHRPAAGCGRRGRGGLRPNPHMPWPPWPPCLSGLSDSWQGFFSLVSSRHYLAFHAWPCLLLARHPGQERCSIPSVPFRRVWLLQNWQDPIRGLIMAMDTSGGLVGHSNSHRDCWTPC